MGQQEILDYLEKRDEWKTTKQISRSLKLGYSSAHRCLKKLWEQGDILRIEKRIGDYKMLRNYWRPKYG